MVILSGQIGDGTIILRYLTLFLLSLRKRHSCSGLQNAGVIDDG